VICQLSHILQPPTANFLTRVFSWVTLFYSCFW